MFETIIYKPNTYLFLLGCYCYQALIYIMSIFFFILNYLFIKNTNLLEFGRNLERLESSIDFS